MTSRRRSRSSSRRWGCRAIVAVSDTGRHICGGTGRHALDARPRRWLDRLNQPGRDPYLYGVVETMAVPGGRLAQAVALGDEVAFTELVRLHHRDLLRVAYVICRDSALAEDSVQAAWSIAWRRIGDVRNPAQVRGWLVAVAANEARRTMRSRRGRVHEISVGDMGLNRAPDLRPDPLARGIAKADLRRVLATLDPTDRALIALRYVAELGSEEIGRALGMSSSGARGRLSRLLVRLRGELGDE